MSWACVDEISNFRFEFLVHFVREYLVVVERLDFGRLRRLLDGRLWPPPGGDWPADGIARRLRRLSSAVAGA